MAEFPGAFDCFVDESRVFIDQNSHSAIVIHGTGGSVNQTAQELGTFFATTTAETSVHYGIDRLGNIAQYVLEKDGAGGNGVLEAGHDQFWDQFVDNPNKHTLSVETINDLTNSQPLTTPQKATLFKLIAYWVKKYQIPLSNIKGHFTLEPTDRANCPGPAFPWEEMKASLEGGNTSMIIPTGWTDDGKTLTAPNKIPVTDGFRIYILTHNWDPDNYPLQGVQGLAQLELSNPTLGAGTQQIFRWLTLEWTAQHGVFISWTGPELLALRATLAQASGQITILQQRLTQITALAKSN